MFTLIVVVKSRDPGDLVPAAVLDMLIGFIAAVTYLIIIIS